MFDKGPEQVKSVPFRIQLLPTPWALWHVLFFVVYFHVPPVCFELLLTPEQLLLTSKIKIDLFCFFRINVV